MDGNGWGYQQYVSIRVNMNEWVVGCLGTQMRNYIRVVGQECLCAGVPAYALELVRNNVGLCVYACECESVCVHAIMRTCNIWLND